MLNHAGGVEADCTVTVLESSLDKIVKPILKEKVFYIGMFLRIYYSL